MSFVAVKRGKFHQLASVGTKAAVTAELYALRVTRSFESNGKSYLVVDASAALGDLRVLRAADAFIRRAADPRFSPVAGDATSLALTLKMMRTTAFADDIGHPAPPFAPAVGDLVDAAVRVGAFGDFGYCLLVDKLKPHARRGA